MRISRLDLTRYGCFTGDSISFHPHEKGSPDLHIIYGANEAGKSTLLSAYLDLLFGIGGQTPYKFLHPYETMRIGGRLQFASGEEEFIRIKKPQGSLLDKDERPISEGSIRRELGGLEREAYRMMFSLNDQYLQDGGESIIASEGDLGVLLFSASAGLAELGKQLEEVRKETENFYKPHARKSDLIILKAELAELKQKRGELDMQAGTFAQLVKDRNQLKVDFDAASEEEGRTGSRIAEITSILAAIPTATELKRLWGQIEPLKSLPAVPSSWTDSLKRLQQEEAELSAAELLNAREISRIRQEIAGIVVDENALRIQEEISTFRELRVQVASSVSDLPRKREDRANLEAKVRDVLARIERSGETEPEKLILSVSETGRLRGLIESWSGVENRTHSAETEREKSQEALAKANRDIPAADRANEISGEMERKIAELSTAVKGAGRTDYARNLVTAERAVVKAQENFNQQCKLLKPWVGTADELSKMECPTIRTVQGMAQELNRINQDMIAHSRECVRLESEQETLTSQLDAISATRGVISDHDAGRIRGERDLAWKQHREDLKPGSADVFEQALRHDDGVRDTRFAHVSDLERVRQLEERRLAVLKDLEHAKHLRDEAKDEHNKMLRNASDRIAMMSSVLADSKMNLADLEAWLGRREKALELLESFLEARRTQDEARDDLEQATADLRGALADIGRQPPPEFGIKEILSMAREIVEGYTARKAAREKVKEREEDLAERKKEEAAADRKAAEWKREWEAACTESWIGEQGVRALGAVREILKELATLQSELTDLKNIKRRIEGMERNEKALLEESIRLAKAVGVSHEGGALELAGAVDSYIESAKAAFNRRQEAEETMANIEREQDELTERRWEHSKRKGEMTEYLEVATLDEVDIRLSEIAKRDDLQNRIDSAESSIQGILGAASFVDAETTLSGADRNTLESEFTQLKGTLENQKSRSRDLWAEYMKAKDRVSAVGGDAAIAKIDEQRKTLLVEITGRAENYLRLRAGTMAAEIALQSYRERHRSTMLQRASDAFRRISENRYTGLVTQPTASAECLIARAATGMSRTHKELSDATRRQLFFALRIAGYHEFVRTRVSLPFIADDVMETFDNPRARETFQLLTEMSALGQVIYLTHHLHLCEIARELDSGVHIYNLNAA